MDYASRLAIEAVVRGLYRSGTIGGEGLAVIIDELVGAVESASERGRRSDAEQITALVDDIRKLATHRDGS